MRVVHWSRGWCRKRVKQYCPRAGEVWLKVLSGAKWYLVQWLPREGWWITSAGVKGPTGEGQYYTAPRFQSDAMKRRAMSAPGKAVFPSLPATSVLFGKLSAIREFCTATQYDDGTERVPGYFTFRNRGHSFELTLYDPDSGHRIAVRAPEWDKTWLLAEQLLGVEDAPWEVDNYLTEQLAKRSKKKRA